MKTINCILLIDDNKHDNFFHALIIKEANAAHHIKTALDGEIALEYLEKAREGENEYPFPDLIFLDINMPKINGFEFLKKAKEKKLITKDKPLIVVMLTSSLNPDDQTTAELTFPDEIKEYKNKPLTEEMLKEIIEKYF